MLTCIINQRTLGAMVKMRDALYDLVPFVQFKKREKHQWRSVTFSKGAKVTKVTLLHWVFFKFLKLYKWYQIAQLITNVNESCLTTFTQQERQTGRKRIRNETTIFSEWLFVFILFKNYVKIIKERKLSEELST